MNATKHGNLKVTKPHNGKEGTSIAETVLI